MLPPFLQKLKMISETVPSEIADWAPDGLSYVVKNNESFEEVLKQHFKGSLQTFIRQLHFYGFRKLDAQNGGWSFVHKNFRKDKPELVSEIRRKTRSESGANGAATQVEVQQLRSQVAKLQGVVEDLRTQLDSVLSVLDTAGVVDVVKAEGGKVASVRLPGPTETPMGAACRKRFRFEDADADADDLNMPQSPGVAQDTHATRLAGDMIEPLPVDIDMEGLDEDIFDLGVSDNIYSQLINNDDAAAHNLAEQLEADMCLVETSAAAAADSPSAEPTPVASPAAGDGDGVGDAVSSAEAANTAKVVADATELDPASVQKVLGFLKKAIGSDVAPGGKIPPLPDLVSFPQIQNAILNYKNVPLPTQEVGAN